MKAWKMWLSQLARKLTAPANWKTWLAKFVRELPMHTVSVVLAHALMHVATTVWLAIVQALLA